VGATQGGGGEVKTKDGQKSSTKKHNYAPGQRENGDEGRFGTAKTEGGERLV